MSQSKFRIHYRQFLWHFWHGSFVIVPDNAAGLSSEHLVEVRRNLMILCQDPMTEPKDRIAAAKEVNRMWELCWKLRPNPDHQSPPAESSPGPPRPEDPLRGLKLIG